MIRFLRGTLIEKSETVLTVDVQGVGYGVLVSGHTQVVCESDKECALYVYTHVREQEITLYGFLKDSERMMFELLISVSGIGPKAALAILSASDVPALSAAITNKDTSILTNVSGIGKKTAQKVVIELQEKVGAFSAEDVATATLDSSAIDALKSMGYSVGEARAALEHVDPEVTDVSERIKAALKSLGR